MTAELPCGDRLEKVFQRQERLQGESFGHSLRELTHEQQMDYIRWNVLALEDELHEALAEVPWKPWSSGDASGIDQGRYFKELVDAFHFFMNLWLVFVPAEEAAALLYEMYSEKSDLNAKRQAEGYDGVSTKCPACRRALDEPEAIQFVPSVNVHRCKACGFPLDTEKLVAAGLILA
jgi:hypothetical protein